jgi:hypothetical protein
VTVATGQFTAKHYPDSKNKDAHEEGMRFQDYVVEQLSRRYGFIIQLYASRHYQFNHGENVQRAEIKLDRRCLETRRLSIEVEERTALDKPWVPSGIYSSARPIFYIHGNFDKFFVFDRKWLQRYHQQKLGGSVDEKPTVKTFYLPLAVAEEHSIFYVEKE